jgi:dTMP kinase
VAQSPSVAAGTAGSLPGVLHIPAFRRLWVALSLSSLGDWLGLLAVTALAASLSTGSYAQTNLAVAGVFLLRLAPAIVLGPLAGAVADRLDRRWTMVSCDVARFLLLLSIPFVGTLWWLYVATFLIECAALFWIPSKEATVPNLVPRERLEQANQVSLLATYGAAPVAAGLFALLTVVGGPLSRVGVDAVDVALVFDALTFLVAALVVARLRAIPAPPRGTAARAYPSVWRTIAEGWRFVGRTPVVRGLVLGMLGAFAAGGAVVGLARIHVADLGAGDPGYGMLFAAVFLGLAAGMGAGPRLLHGFSRRRIFGLAIAAAGLALTVLAVVTDLVLATLVTFVLGAFAGVAWVSGYTLLGLEVADELRGRTFAFVQMMVRIVLVAVLAVAPLVAAAIGERTIQLGSASGPSYNGAAIVFGLAGLLAAAFGVVSYRQMDDRRGIPLRKDLLRALHGRPPERVETAGGPGFLLALEGGEGAGKSTQARLLRDWLESLGHEVVLTREPGGTPVGARLRELLLDPGTRLADRAEALLYAADRAQHVEEVLRPALRRGDVVVTDRYVDSSIAYQGAGRSLSADELARVSRWATGGLVPSLTVLLDVPPAVGLARSGQVRDRLEAEPEEFHDRVREGFLAVARANAGRYLVVDATRPAEEIAERIRARLDGELPVSAQQRAAARAREEAERARSAEEGRRAELARQQRVAAARAEIEEQRRAHAEEVARADAEQAAARRRAQREREERARLAERERARRRAAAESARRIAAEERRVRAVAEGARRAAEERARQAEQRARRRAQEEQRQAAAERARAAEAERTRAQVELLVRRREQRRREREGEQQPGTGPGSGSTALRVDTAAVPEAPGRAAADPPTQERAADPPTQELSLVDELFALSAAENAIDLRAEEVRHRGGRRGMVRRRGGRPEGAGSGEPGGDEQA